MNQLTSVKVMSIWYNLYLHFRPYKGLLIPRSTDSIPGILTVRCWYSIAYPSLVFAFSLSISPLSKVTLQRSLLEMCKTRMFWYLCAQSSDQKSKCTFIRETFSALQYSFSECCMILPKKLQCRQSYWVISTRVDQ